MKQFLITFQYSFISVFVNVCILPLLVKTKYDIEFYVYTPIQYTAVDLCQLWINYFFDKQNYFFALFNATKHLINTGFFSFSFIHYGIM